MMTNSRPRISATPVDGLYLNIGHGMLGWTLACSSGEQVAALVSDADSEHSSRAAGLEERSDERSPLQCEALLQ